MFEEEPQQGNSLTTCHDACLTTLLIQHACTNSFGRGTSLF